MESEIFGHEEGAFSGATRRKLGKMELANRGTLFLDEIGDMDYKLQPKLLRAIEEKEFERLGGTENIKVDVRFIAATNQDLEEAVQEGKFRQDLFYRLDVGRIHIPPLREHKADIPLLIEHFMQKYSAELKRPNIRMSEDARKFLMDYHWPGNVRELRNYIERTIQLADSNIIRPEHLPQEVRPQVRPIEQHESAESGIYIKPGTTWKDAEKAVMLMTYKAVGENKTQAAKVLKMSRRAFVDKWKKYKLDMHIHLGSADTDVF
jgi:transcriptional regulator with PAS, ATPase and Fis domain